MVIMCISVSHMSNSSNVCCVSSSNILVIVYGKKSFLPILVVFWQRMCILSISDKNIPKHLKSLKMCLWNIFGSKLFGGMCVALVVLMCNVLLVVMWC